MKIKVSVIIPVYNVEKTLRRCIDSVLNQTMNEIEIILVNDGSKDSSGDICDEYVKKYNYISVIHKGNEGLGPTRNIGMINAKGEYIYHCDSDDWIDPTLLEDTYNNAIAYNADVVIFGYRMFIENNGKLLEYGIVSNESIFLNDKNEIRQYYIDNLENSFFTQSACNRLVNRDFIENNKLFFEPYRRSQDVIYSLNLFDKLEKLSIVHDHYYNYIIEPGKFKGRGFEEMINIYLDVFERKQYYFKKWNRLDNNNKLNLAKLFISQISNFSSYFIYKKNTGSKKVLIRKLINDDRVQSLFKSIKNNDLDSRFLKLTHHSITKKNGTLLQLIFLIHQAKQRVSK